VFFLLKINKFSAHVLFCIKPFYLLIVLFLLSLGVLFLLHLLKPSNSLSSFTSQVYQVKLSYPSAWKAVPIDETKAEPHSFENASGFFSLSAKVNTNSSSLLEICKNEIESQLNDFGSKPQIQKFYLNAREAYYILPSDDQNEEEKGKACMITLYPLPVWIDFDFHEVLILSASKDHIFQITKSLEFLYK